MKKYFGLIIAIFTCFMTCFVNSTVVNATIEEEVTAEEMKERWYDTRYYPSYMEYKGWRKYDMLDILDILNPPLDLLLSMSTKELVELVQDYPFMGQITNYFDTDGKQNYITFFGFLESNCDIFYELLRREDGITCLLEEFRTHELDVEKLNEKVPSSVEIVHMWHTEIFGCQFIRYYAHHFTENEYELASQIIKEKKELYSLLDDRLLYYFDLPEIERPTGEEVSNIRTNYLWPEEIQEKEDKLAAALLQMQSKENSLPTVMPDIEENSLPTVSNTVNREENNESIMAEPDDKAAAEDVVSAAESVGNESQLKVIIVVGAIIAVVCVIGGFVLIRQRRKDK